MTPKKRIIAASALLAPFALAAIFLRPSSETPAISPSQVYTRDCEFPAQKPEAITLTCGDGGMYVDRIDWSRWDSKGAQGIGTYNVNDCEPSCAEGTFLRAQVRINLSRLDEYQGKFFLRTLVIQTSHGENLPRGTANVFDWDLMEYIEIMGGSR